MLQENVGDTCDGRWMVMVSYNFCFNRPCYFYMSYNVNYALELKSALPLVV